METIRRMALPRASSLLAVMLAAGSVAPLVARAQDAPGAGAPPPSPSVRVLPPRALTMPTLPLLPPDLAPAVPSTGVAVPAGGQSAWAVNAAPVPEAAPGGMLNQPQPAPQASPARCTASARLP